MTATTDPTKAHPAQFSGIILEHIAPIIDGWDLPVHDPFAGTGVRLGRLCDSLHLPFTGTELEPEFIVDPRVLQGDSTEARSYPISFDRVTTDRLSYVIVTSPSYPNGMADHFRARDQSERHTYRQAIANIRGEDRELHEHNMGRYSARAGRKAMELHMDIARRCVAHWPDRAIVNVSDFIVAGEVFDYAQRWVELLEDDHGYEIVMNLAVATPRQRHGANGAARVDHETILVAVR